MGALILPNKQCNARHHVIAISTSTTIQACMTSRASDNEHYIGFYTHTVPNNKVVDLKMVVCQKKCPDPNAGENEMSMFVYDRTDKRTNEQTKKQTNTHTHQQTENHLCRDRSISLFLCLRFCGNQKRGESFERFTGIKEG